MNVYMVVGALVLLPIVGSIVVGVIGLLSAPFRRSSRQSPRQPDTRLTPRGGRGPREDPPLYTGRMD